MGIQRLTNVELENFLRDFAKNSKTEILEGAGKKAEIIRIAKARGINLKDNRDLAGFKTIYTFANKANANNARLPKKALLKALPSMIGKPVDIDHNRRYVIGHYIDYRYIAKEEMVIAYGVFYKSNFQDEWKNAKKLFSEGKLTTSYEIWCPQNKRRMLDDGTYELLEQEIAGGAILMTTEPAFKDAKVLEFAKKNMEKAQDLVYASENDKYQAGDIIISDKDYYKKSVEDNAKKLAEQKIADSQPAPEPEKPAEPEEKEPEVEVKPVEVKCSNCNELLPIDPASTQIKCNKCFCIADRNGQMIHPPQIIDFRVGCLGCSASHWLLLEKSEDKGKVRCLSCAKEFNLTFIDKQVNEVLNKIPFVFSGSEPCPQCQSRVRFNHVSTLHERELECPKCKIKFKFDIKREKYKTVGEITEAVGEIKKEEPTKSSKEGDTQMSLVVLTKYHRYVDESKFAELEQACVQDYKDGLEVAETLTTEERLALQDDMFAVVVRTKDKENGKTRKIRMFPIQDAEHVRNALARLGQAEVKETLDTLGVSITKTRQTILRRAEALNMEETVERHVSGIRKAVKQILNLKKDLAVAKKETELYKANARLVIERRTELGTFANEISDEDLIKSSVYEEAQLAKANQDTAKETVGDEITNADRYTDIRNQITKKAFRSESDKKHTKK